MPSLSTFAVIKEGLTTNHSQTLAMKAVLALFQTAMSGKHKNRKYPFSGLSEILVDVKRYSNVYERKKYKMPNFQHDGKDNGCFA